MTNIIEDTTKKTAPVNAEPSPSTTSPKVERPKDIPEKFWDAEKGDIHAGRLWRSYQELERQFSSRKNAIPEKHEDYCLDCGDRTPDPDVNAVLHKAGFTNDQAQLVYDLASHYVVPELDRRDQVAKAEKVKGRLEEYFGGEERWAHVARQLEDWGKAHLPDDVMESLSESFDGVLALHRMMASDEPGIDTKTDTPSENLDEKALRKLMQDPKYWRDQDPALMAKVRDGFNRLYPA